MRSGLALRACDGHALLIKHRPDLGESIHHTQQLLELQPIDLGAARDLGDVSAKAGPEPS